jgi:hypothetical protein
MSTKMGRENLMALRFAMIILICLTITIVSQAIIDSRTYLSGQVHFNQFTASFSSMDECRMAQMIILREALPRITPGEPIRLSCVRGNNPDGDKLKRMVREFFLDIEHVSAEAPTRGRT